MASQHVLCGAIIALTCVACYYNSTQCDFVFDDISAIKENRDLRPHTPWKNLFFNDFWGTPMHKEQSHKSYRPLCVLTFRWNYILHGLEPYGYHLVNMLLHLVVSLLYFRMCTVFFNNLTSFIAAILFTVHPIHIEAVTGIVGRAETLSSVFFLLAFIFYVKASLEKENRLNEWKYLAISMISVATAMLCKEQGITMTAICAVYEIFVVQKISIRNIVHFIRCIVSGKSFSLPSGTWTSDTKKRLLILLCTTLALLFARFKVMGSQLPVFTRFDNPASVAPSPTRQLTYNYLTSVNIWLLLFPCDLCCDWTMGTVPLVESILDARNLATASTFLFFLALFWIAFTTENQQRSATIIMGIAFMVIPFIPASNLFFPVGFVIAERVLYMPSMGFCILVAYGFHLLHQRHRHNRRLLWIFICVLIGSHAIKTYHRNWDWKNEYTIFMSGLRVNQRNAKLFNNVGHALESDGNYANALKYFLVAVEVQPDDVGAHINVGRTYNHLKEFGKAEEAFLRAKSLLPKAKPGETYQARIAPNHLNVFLNLANLISKNHTRLEEADLLYRQAISMRSDYTQAYINRGDILIKLNRTKDAQEVYERALLYDSTNPDIYYNLGVVLLEQGKSSQALAYLDKALEIDPDHGQALLNSAILLQEIGRPELRSIARERLRKLLTMDDKNERVHFNMGMLAMDDKNVEEAENWFRRAVHLKHDFRSALFNLALLLADDHRPLEAASFLNQLVKYHPDHTKGLILLGDIYINHVKDLDAAENCYKRILQIDPMNIQGLHNLCVVYVERGKLAQALDCLQYAHKLAPHEDYILKHMKIVQHRLANLKQVPGTNSQKTIAFAKYDPKEFGGPANENVFANVDDHVDDLIANVPDKIVDKTVAAPIKDRPSSSSIQNQKTPDKSTIPLDASKSIKMDQNIINNSNDNNNQQQNKRNGHNDNDDGGGGGDDGGATAAKQHPHRRGIIDHDIKQYQQYARSESRYHTTSRSIENQRYRTQQYIHDNTIPMFVHDMDDPSSGTS